MNGEAGFRSRGLEKFGFYTEDDINPFIPRNILSKSDSVRYGGCQQVQLSSSRLYAVPAPCLVLG